MNKPQNVSVIIGRFQVPTIASHAGYVTLMDHVRTQGDRVIVLLGSAAAVDRNNPLPFAHRAAMFQEEYPDFTVLELKDVPESDEQWVRDVDALIAANTTPADLVCLYGSRDSFINCYKRYKGTHFTTYYEPRVVESATAIRKGLKDLFISTPETRAALIQAQVSRNDHMFATADILVTRNGGQEVLLGQKKKEVGTGKFRCIGGFVDKGDRRSRHTAVRELNEEATLTVRSEDLQYVDTLEIVNDARYKYSTDGIMSTVFTVEVDATANPIPGDDIAVVGWFNVDEVAALINPVHEELWECFLTHIRQEKIATVLK